MFSIRFKRNNKLEVHQSKNPEFIVGRASDCDIVISSDVISRHHLKVAITPEEVFIMDLKSANGTYKNGKKIEPNKPFVVNDTDRIRLGNMPDEIVIEDPRKFKSTTPEVSSSGMSLEKTSERVLPNAEELARDLEIRPMRPSKNKPDVEQIPKSPPPVEQKKSVSPAKIPSVPPVLSLQAVSQKVEAILENAKKKAREIITSAEKDAENTMLKAQQSADGIIKDAKGQALKIVLNGEESTKVIIQKAKIDADVILEKANTQAKQIIEKSVLEAELAVEEGRRRGESLVSSELLEIENQKIKLKQIWLEEEKKLWAEFHRKKEEEFSKHKNLMFEEKEKVRKELDEKRSQFAKELVKRQETLKSEEAQFVNKKMLLEDEIEKLKKKEEQQKIDFAQSSLSLKKKYESEESTFKQNAEEEIAKLKKNLEEESFKLKEKEKQLREELQKKSYQLKVEYDEEKSRAELKLSELKKNYDLEIEDYKKKEMDRINSFLKMEQDEIHENKKLQSYQARITLKKAVAGSLGNELRERLNQEQLSSLIQKLSDEIDKTTSELDAAQSAVVSEIGAPVVKTMEKRNNKVSMGIGISAALMMLVFFTFWDSIYDSLKNSESYSKFMFNKMQIESVYVPLQTDEWKSSYHERVLYLRDYVEFKTNPLYTDKWTQHLTNIENARSLKLTEDEMIQFLAREMNLVNQLVSLQKTIDARQLELGIAKLNHAEEEANQDFIRILKTKENLARVAAWEKQFVSEHMSRLKPQRLPSETK